MRHHYVGAIDQGTSSTLFALFDSDGREVTTRRLAHRQIMPQPGRLEHDPVEIWNATRAVITATLDETGIEGSAVAALGIANQRETVVVWNRTSGAPIHPAIVWQDMRGASLVTEVERRLGSAEITQRTGLRPSPYFSASKIGWILGHVPGARAAAEAGDLAVGTIDSWLIWNLTGGAVHATDVTNASRTMLANIHTLAWDDHLLDAFNIPRSMMPQINPSADQTGFGTTLPEIFGAAVPITGVLGDQQAAAVGQGCLAPGDAKCTYGTGNFVLRNTGTVVTNSDHGLLSTVGYRFGRDTACYALEGSVAVTGSAIQWLRDQLGIVTSTSDVESLAASVADTGDAYFVPAFSGLLAPHWRANARGAIVGLSRFHTKAHLARAALESICYQTRDVIDAMSADTGAGLDLLKVDGGVTANELCMQMQADILGIPVVAGRSVEVTARGAAHAAGLAAGMWQTLDELSTQYSPQRRWDPKITESARAHGYDRWRAAVARTLDWTDGKEQR